MRIITFLWLLLFSVKSDAQIDLISTGNFSTLTPAWNTTGNFQYTSYSPYLTNYNSPFGYAYLADFSGAPASSISGTLFQNFFVPAGTPGVTVSFWFRITTAETTTTIGYDVCNVSLVNMSTGSSIPIAHLTNLDKNIAYTRISFLIPSISTGTWRIVFSANNDASLPTVFRIDDVAVVANPDITSSCITWVGGISPSPILDSATEKLCAYNIISSSQNALALSLPINRLEVARCLGNALLGNADISFLDNFPNIFPSVQSLSLADQRFVKLMLFLEYPLTGSPTLGTDDISPFCREYFYPNFTGYMKKSDVLKAMLETWNLAPTMTYYDATSFSLSPMICDMAVSNKNLGWVQRAYGLGLLTGITSTCVSGSSIFLNDVNMTYGDFYILLSRLIDINPSPIGYDAFFVPNLFYLNNLNNNNSISKGVFNEYSNNSFNIPSGGVGLEFQYSYHSNLSEIPILSNDTDNENRFLKPKLQPIGGGWTHTYSAHIKSLGSLGTIPERILIYWPDGTVHSYLVGLNKYETKGVTDQLTINSLNIYNQPHKVTIKRGRIVYTFQNIDPATYSVLSLVSVRDGHGNALGLEYIDGYTTVAGLAPKMLAKVTDSFSSRSLLFSYLPGTNYLRTVTDPIGRTVNFFVNIYNHDLDSVSDPKEQFTRYHYSQNSGTAAYRTHLLTSIRKPKGNTITNNYNNRKLSQTQGANYITKVDAVPRFNVPHPQQNSKVATTQNGQTITTNYSFDNSGNLQQTATTGQSVIYINDTVHNRLLEAHDTKFGFITKYQYDVNGFLKKRVLVDSLFNDSTTIEYANNAYGEVISVKDYNDPGTYVTETKYYKNIDGNDSLVVTNEGTLSEIKHTYTHFPNGLLASYLSPAGYQTTFNYNSYGNPQSVTKIPNGTGLALLETFNYDPVSRLVKNTDYNGIGKAYIYDNNDNIKDIIVDPDSLILTTHYNYDPNDNPTSITSPKGHTTFLSYNFNTDDLIEENDGIDRKRWSYNEDGTLDTFITKNNVLFKNIYYNASNTSDTGLYGLHFSDGFTHTQYWSRTKNPYNIYNLSGKANKYYYDTRYRSKWNKPASVGTENFFGGIPIDNVNYEYDRMQRMSSITYPAFGSIHYSFNHAYDVTTKNLQTVYNASSFQTYVRYSYKKDGSPLTVTYGNGDSIFYHYDSYNRVDSIWAKNHSGTLLYSVGASLDNNGKHTREDLKIYYHGYLDTTLPNLINGVTESYSYQPRNRILTGGGKTYISDNAGNIYTSTGPPIGYTWNNYGQLEVINRGGAITIYTYDLIGNRKRKDNTYFVVDQQNTGNVLMEATYTCSPISAYVYGNGLVCRIDPITDSVFYYHYDFRGSVIAITNQNGDMVQFYKYEPFGKVYAKGGNLTWNNPYQYCGREGVQTDDSDVYYMKARYYQPSTGRFISEDPVWNTNLFVYCDNDPINNIDPNGEFLETLIDVASVGYSAFQLASAPSWANLGMLAWDIASVALPFVPGSYVKRTAEAGFKSFKAFKKVAGAAGEGKAWHHIVEQTPSNIKKFGAEAIHTEGNLMKLAHGKGTIHAQVSGYYSSIRPFTNGKTVRKWISNQNYQQQYDFGIKTLKQFGWKP